MSFRQRFPIYLLALLLVGSPQSSLLLGATQADTTCGTAFISLPPFYVSTVSTRTKETMKNNTLQGNASRISSEFLYTQIPSKKVRVAKELSRGSIVRIIGSNPALSMSAMGPKSKGVLVPVEVLRTDESFRPYKNQKKYGTAGDKGMIWSKSLSKADQAYIFILMQDTKLFTDVSNNTQQDVAAGTALRPVMREEGGKTLFKVYGCPPEETTPSEKLTYLFEPVYDDATTRQEIGIANCEKYPDLAPLSDQIYEQIVALQQMMTETYGTQDELDEYQFNGFGRIRLPVDENGVGPDKDYVCYSPRQEKCNPTWGKPNAVCALITIAKKWKKECLARVRYNAEGKWFIANRTYFDRRKIPDAFDFENPLKAQDFSDEIDKNREAYLDKMVKAADTSCTLQIGDLGFVSPGVSASGKDPLGHASHQAGTCVDVRPMRRDGLLTGTNLDDPNYSRTRTRHLVNFLKSVGADPVLFADPSIVPKAVGAEWAPSHRDHVHFCLVNPEALSNCSTPEKAETK